MLEMIFLRAVMFVQERKNPAAGATGFFECFGCGGRI